MSENIDIILAEKKDTLIPKKVESVPPTPKKAPPKKATQSRTPKKQVYSVENDVRLFFVGMSQILTALPNGEILELKESEIDMLAKPIANILERNNLSETASKYTDYTMLLVAATIITVPRVVLIRDKNKSKKGRVQIASEQTGPAGDTPREGNEQPSSHASNDAEKIHDLFDLFN